ncbi:MAG: zinc ribbon domain-containing protein [Promethearchaeota archaeon]
MTQKMQSVCPACGKAIKVGINFCTNCGADLSELNVKIITAETPTPVATIDKIWANLKYFVKQKDTKEILNFLSSYMIRIPQSDEVSRKKIYDLIGKTINEDPLFFKRKLYKNLYGRMKKSLFPQLRIEMEKYILEKYCFLKGEKFITSSKGSIIFHDSWDEIKGRFYITNKRIIALGKYRLKTESSNIGRGAWGCGGIEFPYMGGVRAWKSFWKHERIYPYEMKAEKFIYSRTSIYLDQIKRKQKKRITCILKFEYERKGKTKTKKDKLIFVPSKEWGESKIDFEKRREIIFSKISEFMNSL